MNWYDETIHENYRQSLEIDRILHRERTGQQDLVIFENATFGRVLALDGAIQTTEADEFIYHEMLAHVPILAHGAVRSVLIIGGGDGGCLEEVLKHPVERATMVDIDDKVITLCREHLPSICGDAFDDPRARIVIADGAKFVAETDARFDVIIVDSTDPIGPSQVLFGDPFYHACRSCLAPGGILITQSGVPFVQADELRGCAARLRRIFTDATFYTIAVPSYGGGHMTLGWASDEPAHRSVPLEILRTRFDAAALATRYYTPEVHVGAFALPGYIRAMTG